MIFLVSTVVWLLVRAPAILIRESWNSAKIARGLTVQDPLIYYRDRVIVFLYLVNSTFLLICYDLLCVSLSKIRGFFVTSKGEGLEKIDRSTKRQGFFEKYIRKQVSFAIEKYLLVAFSSLMALYSPIIVALFVYNPVFSLNSAVFMVFAIKFFPELMSSTMQLLSQTVIDPIARVLPLRPLSFLSAIVIQLILYSYLTYLMPSVAYFLCFLLRPSIQYFVFYCAKAFERRFVVVASYFKKAPLFFILSMVSFYISIHAPLVFPLQVIGLMISVRLLCSVLMTTNVYGDDEFSEFSILDSGKFSQEHNLMCVIGHNTRIREPVRFVDEAQKPTTLYFYEKENADKLQQKVCPMTRKPLGNPHYQDAKTQYRDSVINSLLKYAEANQNEDEALIKKIKSLPGFYETPRLISYTDTLYDKQMELLDSLSLTSKCTK